MWKDFHPKRELLYLLAPVFPALCSRILFRDAFGRALDLKDPKTLNEKLMWLKLHTYRDNELVTCCADKYRVRQYVEENGLEDILIELYGVWDDPEEIDWDALPDSFVLKCNHASGYNILCKDKNALDIEACKAQLKRWIHLDYWRYLAELQYQHIPKRIVCERMLGDGNPTDYKIYCFHGKPTYILTCVGRNSGDLAFYFFDPDWKLCRITRDGKKAPKDFFLPKPQNLDKMLNAAAILSKPFPYVRVDLYEDQGNVYFGELTFVPAAALDIGRLPETDDLFGSLLTL